MPWYWWAIKGCGCPLLGILGIKFALIPSQKCQQQEQDNFVHKPLVYERDGCSARFFPGAKISHVFDYGWAYTEKEEDLRVNPPEDSGSGDVMGCFLAKTYDSKKGDDFFMFFEMAMRNDKVGWSLWVDSYERTSLHSSKYIHLFYKLFLMEKDEKGDWKVRVGYYWRDENFLVENKELHVDLPGAPKWIVRKLDGAEGGASFPTGKDKDYAAIWKQDDSGDGEIFGKIRAWSKDPSKVEIFGREGDFSFADSKGKGYSKTMHLYDESKGRWILHAKGKDVNDVWKLDIGKELDKWYTPFKGKKGMWIPFDGYCGNRGNKNKEDYQLACKVERA